MSTALDFVTAKLAEADVTVDFTSAQKAHIGRLGGRASDLDAVRVASSHSFGQC